MMKDWKGVVIFFVILGFVSVSGLGQSQASTPDKIKIGLMFGMTGPASPIGPVQLKGAQLAIKEVNDKGGVTSGR